MKQRYKRPRRSSLVRFSVERLSSRDVKLYPFKPSKTDVVLGEIPNMPGHCVVADVKTGRVWAGYHTENFQEIPEDET